MPDCCPSSPNTTGPSTTASNTSVRPKPDWVLWGPVLAVGLALVLHVSHAPVGWPPAQRFIHGIVEFSIAMGPSIGVAVVAMGLLNFIPRQWYLKLLGQGGTVNGIVRAMVAGVLLDLCSHGILMVGAKLYREGASFGQLLAFLITSPWNSFSMMLLLAALVGWQWVGIFLLGSALVGFLAGFSADVVFKCRPGVVLPVPVAAPSHQPACCESDTSDELTTRSPMATFIQGIQESTMVLRWVLLGLVMAAGVRAVFSPELFHHTFAPTLSGLGLTLLATSIIEVCSEGSIPIAADLLNHAHAPGNAFAFLMAGVATDMTEILILRDLTGSWKWALWLPALTIPWVLLLGMWLNTITF